MAGADTKRSINDFFRKTEERLPIGYYLAAAIIVMMLGLYGVMMVTGLTADELYMAAITDGLNMLATLLLLISAVLGYFKAKNLKIRNGITAFAVSGFTFFAAEAIWTWYNLTGVEIPYPSFADVFYIIGSVCLIAGIYLITKGLKVKSKGINPIVLVLAIVLSLAMIAAYLLLTDTLSQETIDPVIILDLAYPVLDVICLVLVVNLLMVSFYKIVFEAQVVLAIGVIVMCMSDIYFSISTAIGQYFNGSLIDIFFAMSYMLIAIGVSRYVELTRLDIIVDSLSKFGKKA